MRSSRRELEAFYGPLAGDRRAEFLDQPLRLQSGARGASPVRSELSGSLTALLAAVGVLLLVACANLANLLLARGTARSAEMALRLSLGASRGRLVRQLVTECLVVAVLGGLAALGVAALLFGVLVQMIAVTDSRFHLDFALDPAVLAFTPAATTAALLLFGVLPAWQVTRPGAGASDALKSQARGAVGSRGQLRTGRWLVSAQLALSLPLLCGAALLGRTAYNLQHANLGFETSRLALVRVDLGDAAPDVARREALRRTLLDRLSATVGVQAVSYSHLGMFTGGESSSSIRVEGTGALARPDHSAMDYVGPGYFATLGVPLRKGRDILDSDREHAMPVCVVNEAFAKRFFAGRDPIGLRVTEVEDGQAPVEYRVVGVAGDAHTQALRGDVEPRFFIPIAQRPDAASAPIFLVRTAGAPDRSLNALRATIRDVNPAVEIMFAKSAAAQLEPVTAQDRTTAVLAVAFGSVALALSALGLYGVLAYGVARRGAELALRIALGALPNRVVRMILRETAGLVAVGLLAGGVLAWLASRSIGSLLYGVAPHDPLTLAAATALLLVVALAAAFVPARRASRLDPTTALRQ